MTKNENGARMKQSKDNSKPVVWVCDVCDIATFISFDEAVSHEQDCKKNVPKKTMRIEANVVRIKKTIAKKTCVSLFQNLEDEKKHDENKMEALRTGSKEKHQSNQIEDVDEGGKQGAEGCDDGGAVGNNDKDQEQPTPLGVMTSVKNWAQVADAVAAHPGHTSAPSRGKNTPNADVDEGGNQGADGGEVIDVDGDDDESQEQPAPPDVMENANLGTQAADAAAARPGDTNAPSSGENTTKRRGKDEDTSRKKPTSFVGQRVYAEYPGNGQWYWGLIMREYYRNDSRFPSYAVWFDDCETADDISAKSIITEKEYRSKWQDIFGRAPPKRPRHLSEYKVDAAGNIIANYTEESLQERMSAEDLFRERCGSCTLCTRPACGKCENCVLNSTNPNEERGVCFRKMCLEISDQKKAQPAVGFPEGWHFFFSTTESCKPMLPIGLVLVSPKQVTFRSIDSAIGRHRKQLAVIPNLKRDFLVHVGEMSMEDNGEGIKEDERRPAKKRGRKMKAIDQRELSETKDIGSRVYCKFNNGAYYWGDIVDKREDSSGTTHYSVQFDDGDFLDDISDSRADEEEGNLYTEFEFKSILRQEPPKRPSHLPPAKRSKTTHATHIYTPAELYELRCKSCSSCSRADCGRCVSCINNRHGYVERNECCLQKMCRFIDKDTKKQPAPGLPPDWTFVTGAGPMMMIISPSGDEFNSLDDALNRRGGDSDDTDASKLEFQAHVGGSVLWNDNTHFLVGKEYCHEWTDVDGHQKVIYGMITECERDKLDEDHAYFTVTYNEQSLKDVIRRRSSCAFEVPRTTKMALDWALGGHLAYNSKLNNEASALEKRGLTIPSRRWLTPEMRTEELIPSPDGEKLPRLILVWNAFRLVFTVRPSTIPNSGHGVFVQCTSLVPGRTELKLKRAEMLDLGVYAPFRKEDLKEECVFLVKNFILGLKCEEWAFDTGPTPTASQFDITDDWTGELHDLARHHIPAYVNECKMENTPTIHAEHDPEGVVHYLLGIRNKNLILPADGTMTELFINYGPIYERVRIRKNYSFLPPSKQHIKSISEESAEYLEEVFGFQERDVTSCIRFFARILKTGTLPDEFVSRALCMAVLLRRRAQVLSEELGEAPFAMEFSDTLKKCGNIVDVLLKRKEDARLVQLNMAGDYNTLMPELVRPLLNELPPEEVKKFLSTFLAKE